MKKQCLVVICVNIKLFLHFSHLFSFRKTIDMVVIFQLEDFRIKMGSILPVIPRNNPPQSRTEFSGLNDLLTYISEDYGKKAAKDK